MCIRDRYPAKKVVGKFGITRQHRTVHICADDTALNRALVCLLYTSDAADERSSVDLGGRRIIKKKNIRMRLRRLSSRQHTQMKNSQY